MCGFLDWLSGVSGAVFEAPAFVSGFDDVCQAILARSGSPFLIVSFLCDLLREVSRTMCLPHNVWRRW